MQPTRLREILESTTLFNARMISMKEGVPMGKFDENRSSSDFPAKKGEETHDEEQICQTFSKKGDIRTSENAEFPEETSQSAVGQGGRSEHPRQELITNGSKLSSNDEKPSPDMGGGDNMNSSSPDNLHGKLNSSFPLPKTFNDGVPLLMIKQKEKKEDDDDKFHANNKYHAASSLDSYQKVWENVKLKHHSRHRIGEDPKIYIEDVFRGAICTDKIDIGIDTSITGRYAKKKYVPVGFEPSTEEACKREVYDVVKLNAAEIKVKESEPRPKPHYQSWDPVTMRYEPKRKKSGSPVEVSRAFPLGAAAAGTRAALLSFMGARANLLGPSRGVDSVSNSLPFLNGGSDNEFHGNSNVLHGNMASSSQPSNKVNDVPEKIIIPPQLPQDPDTIQRIVPSETGGGKKIESVSSKQKDDDDCDESYTDSSSKRTRTSIDTDDAKSDRSHLRRTKRKRSERKYYDC